MVPLNAENPPHGRLEIRASPKARLSTFAKAKRLAAGYDSVIVDADGNLYGTTSAGGANDMGTAFKIRAAIVNAAK